MKSIAMTTKEKIEYFCATGSLLAAILIAFMSFFMNNHIIHESVLWFIAQCLVFAASVFGAHITINRIKQEIKN